MIEEYKDMDIVYREKTASLAIISILARHSPLHRHCRIRTKTAMEINSKHIIMDRSAYYIIIIILI